MILRITLKDPDGVYEAVREQTRAEIKEKKLVSPMEIREYTDRRDTEIYAICNIWFQYGESITVEINTDTKTIRVVPADE